MSFVAKLQRAREVLEQQGRLSVRALGRELEIAGDELEELIEELVEIQQVARQEGRALVWIGGAALETTPAPERSPLDYTPKHLADKILQSKSALEGERKQVTVLFADVKGSMELAEAVDPEQWHQILERFFAILGEGVHRFEGTVNQYTGDGIMALFGAPIAHEDHAQRACFASLRLLEELREYAREVKRVHGLEFAVRIGLNSGEVVVGRIGDDLRMDYTAQGRTVGIAQRMESLAEPNSCAMSESTAALVSGYFDLEDLGEFRVKGGSEPLHVYRLEGVGQARTRLDLSRARGFTKFVGRESEVASLDTALDEALAGNGQVVGIVAPAGTGKSRLCLEFVERCRARGLRVDEAHCPAHGKTIAYLPLLEMLRSIFEISDRDGAHEARRKIVGELMLLDASFQELLPLVFDFLGVPDPERPPPQLSAEARQRQMMAFVRHLTQARSEQQPSVLLLDDLHWIDPASDAFLAQAIEAVHETHTLFLVNFRPEYAADWMAKSYYRQLPLAPLGREAVQALLLDLLGADRSLAALPARIHERTGGNPFFVEEVVQSLIESGALEGSRGAYRLVGNVDALQIPATVQSVLAARIDRLAEREKQVLQTASVIGKEIPEPILSAVAELAPEELSQALAALVSAEFVFEKALYPELEYAFKHPLTHEVAYLSQLGDRRAHTHAAVAKVIEAADAGSLDERAALLAHHWEQAGDAATAAQWHRRAALWCERDNPRDALMHWRRVRVLLAELPDDPARASIRLEAARSCLNMGWRQGMLADTHEIFEEGRALARQLGDLRQEIALVSNLASNLCLSGRPAESFVLNEEALVLLEKSGDPELECVVLDSVMNAHFYTGNLAPALEAAARRIVIADEIGLEVDELDVPVAWYAGYQGWYAIQTGRLAWAEERIRSAEARVRSCGYPQAQGWWSIAMAELEIACGRGRAAMAHARHGIDVGEEVASDLVLSWGNFAYGEACALSGDHELGVHHLQLGLDIARAQRAFLSQEAKFLAALALAQLAAGDAKAAIATAEAGVEAGVARKTRAYEVCARSVLARVLLETEGLAAAARVRDEIEASKALIRDTGAGLYLPHVCELRVALARREGDDETAASELREAHRLYAQSGATGHAERLDAELRA